MVTPEGKQDARTEPDSPIPDSDQGSERVFQGAKRAGATVSSTIGSLSYCVFSLNSS